MNPSLPLPFDVRLMNLTAALLVSGLLLACLAAGVWWVLRNPMFAIAQITVSGDTRHNSASSLRASVGHRLAGNFFSIDLAATQAAFEQVPWVRKAIVQREFPDRLHVQLQEHEPVARWGEGDTRLVNRQGEVFEVGDFEGEDDELPVLVGPDGQAAEVLAMYRALAPLVAPLDTRLAELELQQRGHWHAVLGQGAEIELGQGTPDELAARLAQFAATAGEVAVRHQRKVASIESADLRHVGGYALRLQGIATLHAPAAGQETGQAKNR